VSGEKPKQYPKTIMMDVITFALVEFEQKLLKEIEAENNMPQE